MSEWVGDVHVDVIDMDGMDCDIILGLPWHRQYRPKPEWESLVYVVKQDGKDRRIFPLPDSNIIEIGDIGSLNLIDERRAKKLLLKKNTEFRVYYHRLTPREDTTDTLTSIGEDTASPNNLRLNRLLEEYQHIFRSTLPDELPPRRDIEHELKRAMQLQSTLARTHYHLSNSKNKRNK
jgi:hypothetical protein